MAGRDIAGVLLRLCCAAGVAIPRVAVAGPVESAETGAEAADPEPSEADQRAQQLYAEGEKAYRLGDFDLAIEKFRAAYEASSKPQLLYNIGLSHKRRYEVSNDVEDLRTARAVLENYRVEIEKDPELGDEDEIRKLIAAVDEQLAGAEAGGGVEPATAASGEDPGRKLKIAGVVGLTLGVGGMLVGGVVGLALGLESRNTGAELADARDDSEMLGCTPDDARMECTDLATDITDLDDRERLMKNLAIGLGVSLGVVGAVVTTVGAVMFVRGRRRTAAWESGRSVMLVPGPMGASLVGRF